MIARRSFVGGAAVVAVSAALAARPRPPATPQGVAGAFRPEDFGARGDGRTDDTEAFQALGAAVSRRGSGAVEFRRGATYRVGRQVFTRGGADAAYAPQPILLIKGVSGLVVRGNGATLKLNDGLRYGSFDPATGERFDPPAKGKFTRRSHAAAVGRLFEVAYARDVLISDLILDGNMDRLVVGGRWGDVEIQLPATGLQLSRVSEVVVEDVVSRNNGLDGVYLLGRNTAQRGGARDDIVLRGVRCDRNGRQGMSIVGGAGLRVERCTFSNTGQGKVASRPKSGVDVEPNGADWATDVVFEDCRFINNRQVGLLADAGNSRDIAVRRCEFWQGFAAREGATLGSGDAFWLTKQGVVVERCRVHGNVTNLATTARVRGSSFDDAVHPVLGRAAQRRRYLLQQAAGEFSGCAFAVTGDDVGLVYAKPPLTLRDCRLRFAGAGMDPDRAVAFFSPATTLQDVVFTEGALGPQRRYVHAGGARLLGKVVVTGPNVRWNNKTGPVGDVAGRPS